jgi:heme exporter protein A
MSNYPLQVRELSCIRGDRRLFTNLSFELQAGQVLYLKGRNGSGKTTLQRSISGLFQPDAGDILWNNQPIAQLGEGYFQDLLYIGHAPGIKLDLTAVENLGFQCRLKELMATEAEIWDALNNLGLAGFEDLPARVLSAGQKRRIALARLFLDKSSLWILDEPFTALDVAAVELLLELITRHIGLGGMVILTTHQEVDLPAELVQELTLGVATS